MMSVCSHGIAQESHRQGLLLDTFYLAPTGIPAVHQLPSQHAADFVIHQLPFSLAEAHVHKGLHREGS